MSSEATVGRSNEAMPAGDVESQSQKQDLLAAEEGFEMDAVSSKSAGEVYFIRHGESESNRQNRFAGVFDVALTRYGELQARRAGADIRSKKVEHFDAVYSSYLLRAQNTCKLALEESGLGNLKEGMMQDFRIAERSFGTFAGKNIALLRQAFGYGAFEHFLHSAQEAPPAGETMAKVYDRAATFFNEQIQPRIDRGEKVLVVSHQYVIEPLAFFLDGLPASDYYHFNLPNGKAMSRADLVKFRKAETGGFGKAIQHFGDLVCMHAFNLVPLVFLIGLLLRFYFDAPIPLSLFKAFLTIGLFVSTFYSYLEVDLPISFKLVPWSAVGLFAVIMVARAMVTIPLMMSGRFHHDLAGQQFLLYWLVPPALTTSTVSLLWGGGLFLCVVVSLLASFLLPILIIVLAATGVVLFKPADLSFFYILLGAGLILPGAVAQYWRTSSPVEAKRHTKKWNFFGPLAFMFLGFISGFQYTPASFFHLMFSSPSHHGLLDAFVRCYQDFWVALGTAIGMQVLAAALSWVWNVLFWRNKRNLGHRIDLFILLATPNIFLWASLGQAQATATGATVNHADYAVFWLVFLFFLQPWFTQMLILQKFVQQMLIEAHHEDKINPAQLEILWRKHDTDHSNSLSRDEFVGLCRDIQHHNTGNTNINEYVTGAFFDLMDTDSSGSVDYEEFMAYFNSYGLVVQLN